jgi:hypothetical protein
MTARTFLRGIATATALLALAPTAGAQETPSIHLEPARAEGVVENGQGVGPFTIANFTNDAYSMRVFPILLGQSRDGGLFVRDDGASLALARARMAAQVRAFAFSPGAARSVFGKVRRVPRGEGLYGGILFRATPRRGAPGRSRQIKSILQLNARVILDPPASRRRERWTAGGAIRAEQDGKGRLRILVPVTNRGNTFAWAHGLVRVRDAAGRVVARRSARAIRILPGTTVDLPVRLAQPVLPKGGYRLSAAVRGSGRLVGVSGGMELFGPNQVRTERARILDFSAPKAYIGDDTELKVTFRNTGNVAYAPPGEVEVHPLVGGRPGPVVARGKLEGDEVEPGGHGELKGSVKLPTGTRSYELRARLVKEGREVDSRANSVTPVKRPPLTTRVRNYVTEHAIVIVLLILGAVAVAGVFVGRYIRRLQAAAKR